MSNSAKLAKLNVLNNMTLSRYLLIMILATLLCWMAWFLVLFNISPFEATALSFLTFYASLFLALTGTFTVVGFLLRVWLFKEDEPRFREVQKTFRHGLLFGLLLIAAILLQSQRLLYWWNLTLLIMALAILELFFLNKSATK